MSRIRLINPAATKDEALCRCSIHARLAWAYLPCYADKAGRLADKPVTLRFEIFPAELVDMDALLGELACAGLIVRYQVAARRYIQIRTFAFHQKPHRREAASTIPAPPDLGEPGTDQGQAEASLFPASRADPDPVTDPVSDPVTDRDEPDPERADPPEDPRARAIPGDGDWPEQESGTVHQLVMRCRPAQESLLKPSGEAPGADIADGAVDPCEANGGDSPAGGTHGRSASPAPVALARDPPEHRALRLVALFGRVRMEVARARGQEAVPWHAGPRDLDKATDFIRAIEADRHAQLDVEPTMRLSLERAFTSQDGRDAEPNFAFARWLSRFSALREDVRGMRKRAPPPRSTEWTEQPFTPTELWPDKGATMERQG